MTRAFTKHKTSVLFNRHEGFSLSTFAVVTFSTDEEATPKVLIEKFKAAVTKWIKNTKEGTQAWESSCEDFNIGDYASYMNDEDLNTYLVDEGMSVCIDLMSDSGSLFSYDMVLANYDKLNEDE